MRGISYAAILAVFLAPAANAAVWSAACYGQNNVQYLQTIGGEGYLHYGKGDGTYTSVKLKQSYFDGKVVCGSTTAKAKDNEVGAVCADNQGQSIRLVYGSQLAKGVRPEKAPVYCQASVSVN